MIRLTRLALNTFPLSLTLNAVIVVCMSTHKVNSGESKLFLALGALFGAESFSLCSEFHYLSLHFLDGFHVLIYLLF